MAQTLAALAYPIRLGILDLLGSKRSCVCDLREAIDIAPNLLSYQLRVLREAGLVVGTQRAPMDRLPPDPYRPRVGSSCPTSWVWATRGGMTSVSSIEKVMDFPSIISFDVLWTPALVLNGEVAVAGRIPSVDELRRILAGDEP